VTERNARSVASAYALPLAPETPTINRFIKRSDFHVRLGVPAVRAEDGPVLQILVDERRLFAGLDAALAGRGAVAPQTVMTPARFLAALAARRVLGEGERRAIVRRIAATREVGIPAHVRASASFAARALAAIDRGGEEPFEALAGEYRTLLAFANVLDVPEARRRALGGDCRTIPAAGLIIDAVLLASEEDAFAWRRLASGLGLAFEPLDLGPLASPALDRGLIAAVGAILRYADGRSEDDAREALFSRASGVALDDARALVLVAGERGPVLTTIGEGKVALGPQSRAQATRFASALHAVSAAYGAPNASANAVLAALANGFVLDHAPTVAALANVTQAFDAARAFAPAWTGADLIAEYAAEFAAASPRAIALAEPDAALPLAALPHRPVPLRKMHFSASSLNAYAECKRKWYFRYACSAVEDKGSSASFYGSAFHAALETFHLAFPDVAGIPESELASRLDGAIVAAFDRFRARFDAPVEAELQRRRARRTGKRYVRWLVERARKEPFVVVGCELAAELVIDGQDFVGYIDRVDRSARDGSVAVIDYKTGTIAETAKAYRDDVVALREFQLPFYYWARTAAGDRVTTLALVPLKDALLDVAPIELEIGTTLSIGDLERAREEMGRIANLLASGTLTDFPATDDPEACTYCAYRDACRERPLEAAMRFAR
jgi:RecB family exonuclease